MVFDFKFELKPAIPAPGFPDFWGGYLIQFKILEKQKYKNLSDIEARRRNALVVAPGQTKTFTIDISKYEYCDDKILTSFNELIAKPRE